MKFSTREDIDAPIDVVFRSVSDFPSFERAAMRRGIEVERRDDKEKPGKGTAWKIKAPFRGKTRDVTLAVTEYARDVGLGLDVQSSGVTGAVNIELVPLSRTRTRMQIGVELKPETLPARLLLQSMKLAKASMDGRFSKRVSDYARELELRYQKKG